VGKEPDTRRRYEALEGWARERFSVHSIDCRWSAQDFLPADDVPFIGPIDTESRYVYVATGFRKWGMTTGMVSAVVISDLLAGRDNDWLGMFDARRAVTTASMADGLETARQLKAEEASMAPATPNELAPGEAAVIDAGGKEVAAYRDDGGTLHQVSAECTHLGCTVAWNTAERTWDCPCHGSRFAFDGSVINGPAIDPLDPAG
jgi:Rieske Fe-S protein